MLYANCTGAGGIGGLLAYLDFLPCRRDTVPMAFLDADSYIGLRVHSVGQVIQEGRVDFRAALEKEIETDFSSSRRTGASA